MTEILTIRVPSGYAFADDEAREAGKRHKLGAVVRGNFAEMRNGAFFNKWWALVKLGFDYFEDACEQVEYKGKPVQANFDRFRKDITIMAGFYQPVWNVKGEMRIEAESLAWSKMTEDRFAELYSKTIVVLLQKVFNGKVAAKWSEAELRSVVEQIEGFA